MKWLSWFKSVFRREPIAVRSVTQCPTCGKEMIFVEKYTMMGDDLRTYRCKHCQKEHIVTFGTALWKLMSDANKSENGAA